MSASVPLSLKLL